jgi:hypothetical protein
LRNAAIEATTDRVRQRVASVAESIRHDGGAHAAVGAILRHTVGQH